MSSALPVPITFELPGETWRLVNPDDAGVSNAAFLAVREAAGADYVPTISVSGDLRPDDATLEDIADEALHLVEQQAEDVELVKRRRVGTPEAPGVTQVMGATVTVAGRRHDVRQGQVLLELHDVDASTRRVVLILTLTCTDAQFTACVPEFQAMVASVRPGGVAPS